MVYVKWVLGPHNELNPLQWLLGVGGPYLDVDGRIIWFVLQKVFWLDWTTFFLALFWDIHGGKD